MKLRFAFVLAGSVALAAGVSLARAQTDGRIGGADSGAGAYGYGTSSQGNMVFGIGGSGAGVSGGGYGGAGNVIYGNSSGGMYNTRIGVAGSSASSGAGNGTWNTASGGLNMTGPRGFGNASTAQNVGDGTENAPGLYTGNYGYSGNPGYGYGNYGYDAVPGAYVVFGTNYTKSVGNSATNVSVSTNNVGTAVGFEKGAETNGEATESRDATQ